MLKKHPGTRVRRYFPLPRRLHAGKPPFISVVQGFPMDHPMIAIAPAPIISTIPLKELPARILRNPRIKSTAEQQYRISGATDWTKNIGHHPPSMISMLPPILCRVNKKRGPANDEGLGRTFHPAGPVRGEVHQPNEVVFLCSHIFARFP